MTQRKRRAEPRGTGSGTIVGAGILAACVALVVGCGDGTWTAEEHAEKRAAACQAYCEMEEMCGAGGGLDSCLSWCTEGKELDHGAVCGQVGVEYLACQGELMTCEEWDMDHELDPNAPCHAEYQAQADCFEKQLGG